MPAVPALLGGLLSIACLGGLLRVGEASLGDRLIPFRECLNNCTRDHCSNHTVLQEFLGNQSRSLYILGWSCEEECDYACMWETLDWLKAAEFTQIPQFHGKWAFARLLGIQEPASVLFSLTNLAAVFLLLRRLRALPPEAPYRRLWLYFALLGVLTWISSAVYHTRDTRLTERLDYFCAFASILFSLYASLARVLGPSSASLWRRILGGYFVGHVAYLSLFKFDYGYNMGVSVTAAILNTVLWLYWMRAECRKDSEAWPRVQEGALAIVWTAASLSLELADFPPLFHVLDAHALFHAATTPCPIWWASFVVKDSLHLLQKSRAR